MSRVLIACEFSAVVREEFRKLGHDAWSCDLLPTEIPGQHLQCDVREALRQNWDLIIAHPPCTYLSNAGSRWLYKQGTRDKDTERWENMRDGCDFFSLFLNHPCPRIAIENPIQHKHAREIIGVPYTQTIQPYEYGHPETKRTCLWLKGLPKLVPTDVVEGRAPRVHYESPGPDRWMRRSRTLPGLAKAFASQWSVDL